MALTNPGYRPRLVDSIIERYLGIFGGVSIEGPKWIGKTWTAEHHASSEFKLTGSTGPLRNIDIAMSDPDAVLKGTSPRLIDEWQDHPMIWDLVRNSIDESSEKGLYILTGSSVPKRDRYSHSGAGRIQKVEMRTMSLYETGESDGAVSLASLFDGGFEGTLDYGTPSLEKLVDLAVRGGWPDALSLDPKDYGQVAATYLEYAVEDACILDANGGQGAPVNRDKMRMLLRSLARNESTVASNARILKDMAAYDDETVAKETFYGYTDRLDRIHLITDTPCFRPNVRSDMRIGKAPKRHLTDVSLAIAALGLRRESLMEDLNTFGFFFEALCEHDLHLYAEASGGHLFHYRDGRDREIDAIVEAPDGRWGALEIKLGFSQVDRAAENLLGFADVMGKEGTPPTFLCIVCGMTRYAYRRPDGVYVVPITQIGP